MFFSYISSNEKKKENKFTQGGTKLAENLIFDIYSF